MIGFWIAFALTFGLWFGALSDASLRGHGQEQVNNFESLLTGIMFTTFIAAAAVEFFT